MLLKLWEIIEHFHEDGAIQMDEFEQIFKTINDENCKSYVLKRASPDKLKPVQKGLNHMRKILRTNETGIPYKMMSLKHLEDPGTRYECIINTSTKTSCAITGLQDRRIGFYHQPQQETKEILHDCGYSIINGQIVRTPLRSSCAYCGKVILH